MKTALFYPILALCLLLNLSGCKKERRSTYVFGRVTDNLQQPVAGVSIVIYGEKLGGLTKGDILQTLVTDKQGLYSTTVIPAKGYSGLQIFNQFYIKSELAKKYKDYDFLHNGQRATDCCPAMIGEDTEYNFILLP